MQENNELFELSRRNVLGGLGAIGLASMGAGLGTSAYFSDREDFTGNMLTAGELDLKVDWRQYWYNELTTGQVIDDPTTWQPVNAYPDNDGNNVQDTIETRDAIANTEFGDSFGNLTAANQTVVEQQYRGQFADVPDDAGPGVVTISDVKPGDYGWLSLSFHLFDNPGYVWFWVDNYESKENSVNEPEGKDPDEDNTESEVAGTDYDVSSPFRDGELGQELQVAAVYTDGSATGPFTDIDGSATYSTVSDIFNTASSSVSLEDAMTTSSVFPVESGPGGDYPGARLAQLDPSVSPLDGSATFPGAFANSTTYYVDVFWCLPLNHANEIQSDSVSFDFGLYTEQARHNDGSAPDFNTSVNN